MKCILPEKHHHEIHLEELKKATKILDQGS
jgi:hypothetical protein